jgi:hypothetical protein
MTAVDSSESLNLELSTDNGTNSYQKPRIAWGLARAVVAVVICCEGITALYGAVPDSPPR